MPWLGTTVPWFSVAIGLILAAKGSRISFVGETMPFGENRLRFRFVLLCIRYVLSAVREHCTVLDIRRFTSNVASNGSKSTSVSRLAVLNAVWEMRGEMWVHGRTRITDRIRRQLESSVDLIQSFVAGNKFDCIVVPGGVYGSSGIWNEVARANSVRLASFDSGGRGILTVATNGIASQLQDMPRAFSLLKADIKSVEELTFVRNAALAELRRRREGTDRFSSQLRSTASLDTRLNGAVLMALNSPWDSAALGLHSVFDNSAQWIVETIRYLLAATGARVIVRQHPAERFKMSRSSDDYKALIQNQFGADPRVIFIAAADPVNSYDLLDIVSVVVVYTSTIGIEAALNGKIVITPSSSYYSGLGFIWRASSLDQYHAHIINALAGKYMVTTQMKEDALICYYLTQCCNWVSSPFSPEGFVDWIQMPFEDLIKHDGVQITSTAIHDDVPTAFLVHLANARNALRRAQN
jgi:hypothetical protein